MKLQTAKPRPRTKSNVRGVLVAIIGIVWSASAAAVAQTPADNQPSSQSGEPDTAKSAAEAPADQGSLATQHARQDRSSASPKSNGGELDELLSGTESNQPDRKPDDYSTDPSGAPASAGSKSAAGVQPDPSAAPQPYLETIPVAAEEDQKQEPPSSVRVKRGPFVEEIVVTAQKRAENINDVPIAISAFSGDTLKALGATDTRDLGRLVPGFTASDSGFNTPVYTLRGIGFNDATYTATSTVGIYVDEVSLPYSIMTKGANVDLERVEVLKGPQGTLFGRNTTGGAINYIAKQPTTAFSSGISGTYSRFDLADVEGFISGTIAESLTGRFAIRTIESQHGWQYSNTRPSDTLGRQDKQSARGILEWTARDDLTFGLILSGWIDHSEPQAPQAIALRAQNPVTGTITIGPFSTLGTVNPNVRDYPYISPDTDNTQVADWAPGIDWRLRDSFYQAAARAKWNLTNSIDSTTILSYGKVFSSGSMFPQSGLNVVNAEQLLTAHISTVSLETRLSGAGFEEKLHWLVGVNGNRDAGFEYHTVWITTISSRFPDPVTGTAVFSDKAFNSGITDATSLGLFANSDYQLSESLKFSLGARVAQDNRNYQGCTGDAPEAAQGTVGFFTILDAISISRGGTGSARKGDCMSVDSNGGQQPYRGKLNESNLSGRSSLNWTPAEDILLFVSYSRGFKTGGFPVLQASNQSQFEPVTQEQLDATEIGAKVSLFDRRLHFNFGAFSYQYKDKQLLTRYKDPVFGTLPILANAPNSKVQGLELETQATPWEGLHLSQATSYIRTEITEFISTNIRGELQDFSGKPFNFAPRLQTSFLVDQTFHPSEHFDFAIGADYTYTTRTNSTLEQDPLYTHRPFSFVGAHIRLSDTAGRWTLLAFGRNLTNEFSTISVFQTGDAVARHVGRPRTYGITLSYSYD